MRPFFLHSWQTLVHQRERRARGRVTARIEIPANIAVYYPAHAHMYMWQVRIRMSSRRSRYRRCGHCEKLVSEKTFKEHHRLFYHEGQWMTEHTRPSDDASSRDSSPLSLQLSHNSDIHSDRASAKSCGHSSKISGLEEGNGDMRASTVASTLRCL